MSAERETPLDDLADNIAGWLRVVGLPQPTAQQADTLAKIVRQWALSSPQGREAVAWAVFVRGVRVALHFTEREACDDATARCKSGIVGVAALALVASSGAGEAT